MPDNTSQDDLMFNSFKHGFRNSKDKQTVESCFDHYCRFQNFQNSSPVDYIFNDFQSNPTQEQRDIFQSFKDAEINIFKDYCSEFKEEIKRADDEEYHDWMERLLQLYFEHQNFIFKRQSFGGSLEEEDKFKKRTNEFINFFSTPNEDDVHEDILKEDIKRESKRLEREQIKQEEREEQDLSDKQEIVKNEYSMFVILVTGFLAIIGCFIMKGFVEKDISLSWTMFSFVIFGIFIMILNENDHCFNYFKENFYFRIVMKCFIGVFSPINYCLRTIFMKKAKNKG